jgi:hypothetical protein
VVIVEQSQDGRRFNRGALLNIGCHIAFQHGATSVVLHDIDLIPEERILPFYFMLPKHPFHLGWAWTEKYSFNRFFGGIVSMTKEQYLRINGFPYNFWGWGGEDDALLGRIQVRYRNPVILRPDLREGYRSLAHPHAGNNTALVNLEKHANVFADTGKDGIHSLSNINILSVRNFADNIKKVRVKL